MKCGNCGGDHPTIAAVRECHEVTKPEKVYATDKQRSYLNSLLDDRMPINDIDVENLSKQEASVWIDKLLKMPRVSQHRAWELRRQEATVKGTVPKHGTYTVVYGTLKDGTQHRTLRIKKIHPQSDRVVVEYLYGPQNTSDFRRFADVVEGGIYVHNGFKQDSDLVDALQFLLNADNETLKAAGYKYALDSGNCAMCGRKLTVPASIHAGIGPVCASKGWY